MITTGDISKLLASKPFAPFTLQLSNDRAVHVPHPEFAFIPPNAKRHMVVSDEAGRVQMINLSVVVSIDVEPPRGERPGGSAESGAA